MKTPTIENIAFDAPSAEEMQYISRLIREFKLDGEDLSRDRMLVLRVSGNLAGFGRMKFHPDCLEFCSLGVLPEYRNVGIGASIVEGMIRRAPAGMIHIATVVPGYFHRFGFRETDEIPPSLLRKIDVCAATCHSEKVVVMRLEKSG